MNFNVITLGCKVNQYESQAIIENMLKNGFRPAEKSEKADITVINSCTVTSVSDAKNRKLINKVRRENPDGVIVLTGCMPQAFPDRTEDFDKCDIVLGNAKRSELVPAINEFLKSRKKSVRISEHISKGEVFENLSVSSFGRHTRAFLKIEDGCDRFCSYCIIPYARGRVRSKSLEPLKKEIGEIAANGYREIVLVGINLSAYGSGESYDLADAVETACAADGIERVRLGSVEPERMDSKMIQRLAAQKKFCPQFHLSLQSGCDRTLKAMNRHYNTAEYVEIVKNIRGAFDNPAVTTDVMVGFAGESGEDFLRSMEFVREIGFAKIHVFPYSQRQGTAAAGAPDQISDRVKSERAERMGELAAELRADFLKTQVGTTASVLIERFRNGSLEGYTENYTPVRIPSNDSSLGGKIREVKIISTEGDYCAGELN